MQVVNITQIKLKKLLVKTLCQKEQIESVHCKKLQISKFIFHRHLNTQQCLDFVATDPECYFVVDPFDLCVQFLSLDALPF